MRTSLRVASWNIWIFGKRDYRGIAKLIRDNKIDIIGIQEAAIYFKNGKRLNIAQKIANEIGYWHLFCPSKDLRQELSLIQGNAIISRFPISGWKVYKLKPFGSKKVAFGTEQRILVAARVNAGSKKFNFLTTHLLYSPGLKSDRIRITQVRSVIDALDRQKGNTVLTGDFNCVPKSKEVEMISRRLARVGGVEPTWTVHPFDHGGWYEDRLRYRIDNIFVSKGIELERFKVLKSKISDHLPIMADIVLD